MNILFKDINSTVQHILEYPVLPKSGITVGSLLLLIILFAVVIVGDEILSGHVRDANTHFIASRLAALGHRLRRGIVVSDRPEEIAAAIDRIAIGRALMTLGKGQGTWVYLRFLVGLDDGMIGELLGCSRVTVRTQIARGLRKLRSVLQDGSLEGGEAP